MPKKNLLKGQLNKTNFTKIWPQVDSKMLNTFTPFKNLTKPKVLVIGYYMQKTATLPVVTYTVATFFSMN